MRIAVLSDFHLGFSLTSELEKDAFENAKEAMERALDSDLVIIAGDIFDTKSPKPRTWYNVLRLLSIPLRKEARIKLIHSSKELKEIVKKRVLNHLPVIALHGNHERSPRGEVNAIQILESAGLLIYLHRDVVVFEKDDVRVAIHGMSHVPERFAFTFLKDWNPQPIEDCVNILLLHQSIDPYIYSPIDAPSLNLSNLPRGFDIIIDGHVHTSIVEKVDSTLFIIPGSTVITQFQPSEAQTNKGFIQIEIEDGKIRTEFIPLRTTRRFFYKEIEIERGSKSKIEEAIEDFLKKNTSEKKPVIRLKIMGEEVDIIDKELQEIEKRYKDRAIILFSKEIVSPEIRQKIELLRSLREQRKSVKEIGMSLLEENLKELGFEKSFDVERIFHILEEGDVDKAISVLLGEQITLDKFKLSGWLKS